jgi:hypothetical protein
MNEKDAENRLSLTRAELIEAPFSATILIGGGSRTSLSHVLEPLTFTFHHQVSRRPRSLGTTAVSSPFLTTLEGAGKKEVVLILISGGIDTSFTLGLLMIQGLRQ